MRGRDEQDTRAGCTPAPVAMCLEAEHGEIVLWFQVAL